MPNMTQKHKPPLTRKYVHLQKYIFNCLWIFEIRKQQSKPPTNPVNKCFLEKVKSNGNYAYSHLASMLHSSKALNLLRWQVS